MRITFIITGLGIGGAERILTLVANGLAHRGHSITVLTMAAPASSPQQRLSAHVTLTQLDLTCPATSPLEAVRNNIRRLVTLRKAIRATRPDVVVPFMDTTNVLTLLALMGTRLPVIACERTDPSQHEIGAIWTFLRKLSYRRASRVLVQTSGIDSYFSPTIRKLCRVMPNPVDIDCQGEPELRIPPKSIVSLGRLSEEKEHDRLIHAFAALAEDIPEADLWILGEGPERQRLEAIRKKLDLEARIHLPGMVTKPGPCLRQATIFVLSSRFEGFPVALCEAMACGLAVICTEFSKGARDIITSEDNGLLVPKENTQALTAAIRRLITDENFRQKLAAKAPEVLDTYGLERILDRWEATLEDLRGKA